LVISGYRCARGKTWKLKKTWKRQSAEISASSGFQQQQKQAKNRARGFFQTSGIDRFG